MKCDLRRLQKGSSSGSKKNGLLKMLQALVGIITGDDKPVEANSELGWRVYSFGLRAAYLVLRKWNFLRFDSRRRIFY